MTTASIQDLIDDEVKFLAGVWAGAGKLLRPAGKRGPRVEIETRSVEVVDRLTALFGGEETPDGWRLCCDGKDSLETFFGAVMPHVHTKNLWSSNSRPWRVG